jgi:hypothetical protein
LWYGRLGREMFWLLLLNEILFPSQKKKKNKLSGTTQIDYFKREVPDGPKHHNHELYNFFLKFAFGTNIALSFIQTKNKIK